MNAATAPSSQKQEVKTEGIDSNVFGRTREMLLKERIHQS